MLKKIAWLDLQLQQGAGQLHLQKALQPLESVRHINENSKTYQNLPDESQISEAYRIIVVQTPNHLTLSRLKK